MTAEAKLAQKERELKKESMFLLDRLLKTGQELIQKRIYLQNFRYSGIVNENRDGSKSISCEELFGFHVCIEGKNDLICPQKVHFKIWQCSKTQRLFASEIKEIK